jgi:hypothetical protein
LDKVYQSEIEDWLKHKKEEVYKSEIGKKFISNVDKIFLDSIDKAIEKEFPPFVFHIDNMTE